MKEFELRSNQQIILGKNLLWVGYATVCSKSEVILLSLCPGKRPRLRSSGLLSEAECKKETKKTIGKNVGHKDADNKVWGDREAALQNAGKVRWQVDKMAFDVDSSACINILNLRPFSASTSDRQRSYHCMF